MCGSLPVTYISNGQSFLTGKLTTITVPNSFCLYDRYMINAYIYAQKLGVPCWNITQAFLDVANSYLAPPQNSQAGEMLWLNPQQNFSASFSSRYYDEYAETLSLFLLFAEVGVNTTISYNGQELNITALMDDMWLSLQNLWSGTIYGYKLSDPEVECELGNFAQIIVEYQNYRGNITYFDRVVQDLEYTLLQNGFSSPAWGQAGVLQHADDNSELRLWETTGALIALQMLYPYFTSDMQIDFRSELENGMWQGLVNNLCNNNQFQFVTGGTYCDDASSLGAMTLFLDGIVPGTGYLAINASNEAYQDYRTCFPTAEWQFNYQTQSIRIPVMAGTLSFIFGSQEVTQNFTSNGVYTVQFSSDWNSIVSVLKVENISSVALPPATLQTIQRPASASSYPISSLTLGPTSTPIFTTHSTATPKVHLHKRLRLHRQLFFPQRHCHHEPIPPL